MTSSEIFKGMTVEEIEAENQKVLAMNEDELEAFLNGIDPDKMGFVEKEGE